MFVFWIKGGGGNKCLSRQYEYDSVVCVCNSTYCDSLPKIKEIPVGTYQMYTSSKEGLRFQPAYGSFFDSSQNIKNGVEFLVQRTHKFQSILGFGGAFTDSAGINILSLTKRTQENLLRSYFSPEGIEYNFGRVPIAGTDFSTYTYTYDDHENDASLSLFNLTKEDYKYKIPLVHRAQAMSDEEVRLIATAWTAPPWMKTNHDFSGFGFLKKDFNQAWAQYHIRFLDEYHKAGVNFWAVTTGNEPLNGMVPINRFNSLGWTPAAHSEWISENLGPSIRSSRHNQTLIIGLDDQRILLPWWMDIVMRNPNTARFVDGIGVHWYLDNIVPVNVLDRTHTKFPDKFIINTEACNGDKPWDWKKVQLGSWKRAEAYIESVIQDLHHWVAGWVDWNLALDKQGGPNWAKNFVDSPIIVDPNNDEFYKQPMFYALGHFSKFIRRGASRIGIAPDSADKVFSLGVINPDGGVVVVLFNKRSRNVDVTLTDPERGSVPLTLPKRSISTLVYW